MKNTRKVVVLLLSLMFVLGALFALTACSSEPTHVHTWENATCTTPKTCTTCGATAGLALGHVGGTATCDDRAACDRCGELYGSKAAHDWVLVNCTTRTCKVCTVSEGTGVQHKGGVEVCGSKKACEVCGELYGPVVTHHNYTVKIRSDRALAEAASCKGPAIYYLSCPCGAIGTGTEYTFEYGVALDHKDDDLDHACDYGCRQELGDHVDADKDHLCDYGCAEAFGKHVDSDKDHFCDKYGADCGLGGIGEHVDADKDHRCDMGCKVQMGTCEDVVKDHYCDYGCGKYYGIHEDMNHDHACDYGCDVMIGSCVDNNKDHNCDYGCGVYFDVCEDSDSDKDHACDYCGKILNDCVDTDFDHTCDVCGKNKFGTCEDKNLDHACDYGCDKFFGVCQDVALKDGYPDHYCDYGCGKYFGTHADAKKLVGGVFVAGKDHLCDYCGAQISECVDEVQTIPCDYCGNTGCEYCRPAGRDHICDICGGYVGAHVDLDHDHACDYEGCILGEFFGEHVDADKNHTCDYGCDERIGEHVDSQGDNDHKCDYCGEDGLSEHIDGDRPDHYCNVCGLKITNCEDLDKDHACDVGCGAEFGKHEDVKIGFGVDAVDGKDHLCDYGCADLIGLHTDLDYDHFCDYGCEIKIGEHLDPDHDHACDYCGARMGGACADPDKDHKCDYCQDVLSDHVDTDHNHLCDEYYTSCAVGKIAMDQHVDMDSNHLCDYGCLGVIGACDDSDNDGDHVCDYGCGKVWTYCKDADMDHDCDECPAFVGSHSDPDRDHLCNEYGDDCVLGKFGLHEDKEDPVTGYKDHLCDYGCKEVIGDHVDEIDPATGLKDHKCDYGCCKEIGLEYCVDGDDKNHVCDYGCGKRFSDCVDNYIWSIDLNAFVAGKDHRCDVCEEFLGVHEDTDFDHFCEYGCNLKFGAHVDEIDETTGFNDHICDYYGTECALGRLGGDCFDKTGADEDGDHVCDWGCGAVMNECYDVETDDNHACEICGGPVGECFDSTAFNNPDGEDGDHKCDLGCGKILSECYDDNFDHHCDVCHAYTSFCFDATGDEEDHDHLCDFAGCRAVLSDCVDEDKDHTCDVCPVILSAHADANYDHICDLFGLECTHTEELGKCFDADNDNDHLCDYGQNHPEGCREVLNPCVDVDPKPDHHCDICHAYTSVCEDLDRDHYCDAGCGEYFGVHEDLTNVTGGVWKDHKCDYGCEEEIGDHVDANHDHICDYGCREAIGECVDTIPDGDHVCDYGKGYEDVGGCQKVWNVCFDDNKDHKCDDCGADLGGHEDANFDHICDYGCGVAIGAHADKADDADHKCEYCGGEYELDDPDKRLEECVDALDAVTGFNDHFCDICGLATGYHVDSAEDDDHVCDHGCGAVLEDCEDNTNDHQCDVCDTFIVTIAHVDTNKDHLCDAYGDKCAVASFIGVHDDTEGDDDHACDYCGGLYELDDPEKRLEDCYDLNGDHHCDLGCLAAIGECVDENEDHICDLALCNAIMSDHVDADKNHECDLKNCHENVGLHVDNDKNHYCDEYGDECAVESFIGEHKDADDDKDHKCDYCGGLYELDDPEKRLEDCYDLNEDHHCDLGCETPMGKCFDSDGDGDHKCDLENCHVIMTECAEGDVKDHKCDECGLAYGNAHADADKNHYCDVYGDECAVASFIGVHDDTEGDKDHKCDYCGSLYELNSDVRLEECFDTNNDHHCELGCADLLGKCSDDDENHKCDLCGVKLTECVDYNLDHECDYEGCTKEIGMDRHVDSATDKNHVCDYGCGATLTKCADADFDHYCDDCESKMSECIDEYTFVKNEVTGEVEYVKQRDHLCDYCLTHIFRDHEDVYVDPTTGVAVTPKNHICEWCGLGNFGGDCNDADKDHDCDYCNEILTTCVDGDFDHACDICEEFYGTHVDNKIGTGEDAVTGKDHLCDLYGAACNYGSFGVCEDVVKDHYCDYGCGKYFNVHEDKIVNDDPDGKLNAKGFIDHICDYCGEVDYVNFGEHIDEDLDPVTGKPDHVCDNGCYVALEPHVDGDIKNHTCEYCGCTVIEECYDNDFDHYCDAEGCTKNTFFDMHVDAEKDADDLRDHLCDYCGDQLTVCVDANKDHVCDVCGVERKCDVCGVVMGNTADGTCKDEALHPETNLPDHLCDYCEVFMSGIHDDVVDGSDKNHLCEYCGVGTFGGKCGVDNVNGHDCGYCGKHLNDCVDDNKDHDCDICKEIYGSHADVNSDHICDFYGDKCVLGKIGACEDNDKNHACDYGCTTDEFKNGNYAHEDVVAPGEKEGVRDHLCDAYGAECKLGKIGECKDENYDHLCDLCCLDVVIRHVDTNFDHICDEYGDDCNAKQALFDESYHVDTDFDHLCDLYGADCAVGDFMDTHTDKDGDNDHLCNAYGAECKLKAGVIGSCVDENKDHVCDECPLAMGTHADNDKDHVCDGYGEACLKKAEYDTHKDDAVKDHICDAYGVDCAVDGGVIGTCVDVNYDHICDHCGNDVAVKHVDIDKKDHVCDAYGEKCIAAAFPAHDVTSDENTDHICDYCLDATKRVGGECADDAGDKNHLCDYGCGKTVSDCVDVAPKDHECDECGEFVGARTDDDKNHKCDYCGEELSVHADNKVGLGETAQSGKDHLCDVYGAECAVEAFIGTHDDVNKDHFCDYYAEACYEIFGTHADTKADDHLCDYCNGKVAECYDKNFDHACDVCAAELSACVNVIGNDHLCDEYGAACTKNPNVCVDNDQDHYCDYGCAEKMSECVDEDPKDHKCDFEKCDETVGVHGDFNDDGKCDHCDAPISPTHDVHVDNNNDHLCDNGGEIFSECGEGSVIDHKCDVCGIEIDAHADTDKDHKCDVTACGKTMSNHVDGNKDHVCDNGCSEAIGTHADPNKDHVCDYGCSVAIGAHEDVNPVDDKCDYCGGEMNVHEHVDAIHDHVCDVVGCNAEVFVDENKDHFCDLATCGRPRVGDKHNDIDLDEYCDYCGRHITHKDVDADCVCDVCEKAVHKDENADKVCVHLHV